MAKTETQVAETRGETAGVALSLSLDEVAEEAFSRLTKSLPALALIAEEVAEVLSELAADLVVVPAEKAKADAGLPSFSSLIKDLEIILAQVEDEATKSRLGKAVEVLKRTSPDPVVDEEEFFEINVRVFKAEDGDDDERTVLGVVLEPETVDAQDDIYSEEEVRKTAYQFMERYQQFGLMHKEIVPSILPLESYLAPVDFELAGQKVKKGTWLVRVRVLDDGIWKRVKSGELTGFSIGGSAVRRPDVVRTAA